MSGVFDKVLPNGMRYRVVPVRSLHERLDEWCRQTKTETMRNDMNAAEMYSGFAYRSRGRHYQKDGAAK